MHTRRPMFLYIRKGISTKASKYRQNGRFIDDEDSHERHSDLLSRQAVEKYPNLQCVTRNGNDQLHVDTL